MLVDEIAAIDIVRGALKAPFFQILKNAGVSEDNIYEIMGEILNNKSKLLSGYDALNMKHIDNMVESGIIDPVKVVISALESAISAAGILLTTEVAIVDDPSDLEY